MILAVCVGVCNGASIENVTLILSLIHIFLEVIDLMKSDSIKMGVGICGVTPKSESLQKSTAFVATVFNTICL